MPGPPVARHGPGGQDVSRASEPPAFTQHVATAYDLVQESEVVKAGHRARLQVLVTDAATEGHCPLLLAGVKSLAVAIAA